MKESLFNATFDLRILDGSNGFTVSGLNINDTLGFSVNMVGDINNDGIADIAIGAPNYWRNIPENSASYIIFGKAGGFPAHFDLRNLNGTNGFIIPGLNKGGALGWSINTAGDMNSDGIDDFVIGAPNGKNAGTAYIIFGQPNFPAIFNLSTLNGSNGFIVPGTAGDWLGVSVNTAGDMNSDGIADLVISAPNVNGAAGSAYIIFGQTGFPAIFNLSTLNGANGFTVPGLNALSYLGYSVSTAGDINGDEKSDIVLGAPFSSNCKGASYIIFGQKSFPKTFDLRVLNGKNGFTVTGIKAGNCSDPLLDTGDRLGNSVSTAGDMNGDGKTDLILGAIFANNTRGTSYVIFGQSEFPENFDLLSLNGTNGFTISGLNVGDILRFGSTVGDINGDGKTDIVLGATGVNSASGASYAIFGQEKAFQSNFNLASLNGMNGFTIPGLDYGELGLSVSTTGDINNDGITDIAIGAPFINNYKGISYIIYGQSYLKLVNNQLTIMQGQTVILSSENLSATDLNFPANTLIFNVSNIQGGRFEFLDNPNVSVTSFTQQHIMDAKIQFVQDGSKKVRYKISVNNTNGLNTLPAAAHVNFIRVYQPPKLNNPIPDQSVKTNVPFNIEIPPNTFIDPDGDFNSNQLIYSASQADGKPLPDWLSFANQSFSSAAPLVGNNRFSLFAANPANRSAVSSTNFSLSVVEASLSFWSIIYIGIGAGGGALLLITLGALLYCRKKETPLQPNPPAPPLEPTTPLIDPTTINPTDEAYRMDFRDLDSKHIRR